MPFFIRGQRKLPSKKRVLKGKNKPKANAIKETVSKKRKRVEENDEEIVSDDDEDGDNEFAEFKGRDEDEDDVHYKEIEEETPQEKKVRLAKQYLEELRKQKEEEAEDDEQVKQAIGLRLKEEVLEAAGRLQVNVASSYETPDPLSVICRTCKHHKLPLTCIASSSDEKFVFTASKDCTVVKWTLQGERLGVIPRCDKSKSNQVGHKSHIISLALSTDGKFLASGDIDGIIHIWNAESLKLAGTFKKHRGSVSGLAFRRGTHTLYSASHDRLVMSWDLDEMAFAENLGGHQDAITGIDSLMRESCITSGGRDEMVIVYVLPEEKQLRFSAAQGSTDGVKLVNEQTFITFGQNGSLALWTTLKKKPHSIIAAAHGRDPQNGQPLWLTAAAALINTDVIASGSMDGFVRLWKIFYSRRSLQTMFSIPVSGVVNGLEFTPSGSHLIAAVGKEHKLGRWFSLKSAKNAFVIIPLKKKS